MAKPRLAVNQPSAVAGCTFSAVTNAWSPLDAHGEEVFDGQSEDEFVARGFRAMLASQRGAAEADRAGIPAVHLGMTQLLERRAVYRSDVSMRDGHEPSARSLLADLTAERWYFVGELSEPEPDLETLLRALGVSLLRIPGKGHAMGLQNPRGLAEALAGVLAASRSEDPGPGASRPDPW